MPLASAHFSRLTRNHTDNTHGEPNVNAVACRFMVNFNMPLAY